MPGQPTTPSLQMFSVRNPHSAVLTFEYEVSPNSSAIRKGDPVKEISGGLIVRASITDTAILGFGEEPAHPSIYVAREIPIAPIKVNPATGNTLIRVAVAGGGNIFTAKMKTAPVQANVTKMFDLAYAVTSPTAAVTPTGTTGATTYNYKIVVVMPYGQKAAGGSAGSTTTGNATLNGTNYNALTWTAVTGAASYEVWKDTGGGTYALLATVTTNSYNDIGGATTAGTIQAVNDTGFVIDNGTSSTNIVQITGIVKDITWVRVDFVVPSGKSQYVGVAGA